MFTNYCMNPLEIFEIEDDCCSNQKPPKRLDQVAPSTSTYLIQLDITADNDAQIKLQIRDTAKNMKMTAVIEDNDLDQYLTKNSDSQQYLELETIDKSEFMLLMNQDP